MVQRTRENAALAAVAQRVRGGFSMVVTIEGDAGTGKTQLIDDFVSTLEDFTRVGDLRDRVTSPTIAVYDDAQWLSVPEVEHLGRSLVSLEPAPLLVIVAGRTGESSLIDRLRPASSRKDRGLVLTLGPLTSAQVIELAAQHGVAALEPGRADLLTQLTDGNALHLATVIAQLGQRLHVAVPRDLPIPASYQPDLEDRLKRLDAPAKNIIELLAILEGPTAISTLVEIAARLELPISFDAVVDSGFVRVLNPHGQRELDLASNRARQAVRQSLDPRVRRARHAAAAQSFEGTARLTQRLLATQHVDDELADELVEEGARLASRGRYFEAARLYSSASGVSSVASERERRLLHAGSLAFYSDDAEFASAIAPSVARCSPSREREMVLGGIGYLLGDFPESLALVRSAIAHYPAEPLLDFAAAVVASLELAVVDLHGAIRTASAALSPNSAIGPPSPSEAKLRITSGFALWIVGLVDDSDAVLAPLLSLPLHRPERADALTIYAQREFYGGDAVSALHTVNLAIESARASDAKHLLPFGIALRAHMEFSLGQWDSAMVDAHAVLSHTSSSRNGNHDVLAHSAIAMLSAHAGQLDDAAAAVRVAHRLSVERPLPQHSAAAGIAAAVVERAGGHPHAVVRTLTPLCEGALGLGLSSTGFTGWRAMLAEALIALGSYERANTVISLFESERCIRFFGYPDWLRGLLAEAQGDRTVAHAAYRAAVASGDEATTPFAHALALRSLGSLLVASGADHVADGTAALATADHLFARLGATAYLPLGNESSRGGGLESLTGWSTLTPREHDTSLLASEGLLNREIAAEMHVAVKTVEHHVANSLAKLGLRSRRDLERAAGRRS